MVSEQLVVKNRMGFHARPAAILTQVAIKYKSRIDILFEDKKITAKSILGIMSAGIPYGATIVIQCDGEDEVEAMEAILNNVRNGLGEEI